MVRELQTPGPGSKPLSFKNHYSTGLLSQVSSCSLSCVPASSQACIPRHVLNCMHVLKARLYRQHPHSIAELHMARTGALRLLAAVHLLFCGYSHMLLLLPAHM